MKKTNRLFLMVLVAGSFAMLLGSCKKNEERTVVSVALPEVVEEGEGKAYIDFFNGNSFKWNGNDQVVVYNLATDGSTSEKALYATSSDAAGQPLADFTFVSGDYISAKQYGYFMFYPASKVEESWNTNPAVMPNYQYFNVSPTQEYTLDVNGKPTLDPTSMAMAVEFTDLTDGVQLKHIFGFLKLKLKGTGNVTKIVVEDSRFNLNGRVAMKLHEVNMDRFTTAQNYFIANDDPYQNGPFMAYWADYSQDLGYYAEASEGGKLMTLNCPGIALNTSTETLFFMGLRPGALKYGFKVYVYTDNATTPAYTYTSDNSWHYGIKAGVIKNLALSF